jgi:hypothetical protein
MKEVGQGKDMDFAPKLLRRQKSQEGSLETEPLS